MKEKHRGDGPCAWCKTLDNPVWFTDNTLWNQVVKSKGDILCVNCFVEKAQEKYEIVSWRLIPEFPRVLTPQIKE